MKQPDAWTRHAQNIIASGRRPHFAPSEEVLTIQRRRIDDAVARHGAGCRAVVLGATPELADLALAAGCQVLRVDSNPAMFDAAARRRTVADRRKETVVVGDWLHMAAVADGAADIVLGDSSLNNVPHADMQAMLAELARITRAGSMISMRQIVLPDAPVAACEFDAIVAAFRAGSIGQDQFHWGLRFYGFAASAYDPETHVLDARRVFAEIASCHAAGLLTGPEFDFLMRRKTEIRHTVYRRSEQRRLLERLGACEDVAPSGSCARELFGVYLVRVGEPAR